ncbi:sensor histidine kinase [Streptomyces sp. WAC05292]|nr:sensor histidine kinase [Streptomyces sp. WAC05292]
MSVTKMPSTAHTTMTRHGLRVEKPVRARITGESSKKGGAEGAAGALASEAAPVPGRSGTCPAHQPRAARTSEPGTRNPLGPRAPAVRPLGACSQPRLPPRPDATGPPHRHHGRLSGRTAGHRGADGTPGRSGDAHGEAEMGRRADETRPGRVGTASRRGRTALWSQQDGLVAVGAAAVDLVGFTVTSQMDLGHVPLHGCLVTVAASLFLLARRRVPLCVLACVLAANTALTWSSSVGQHYGAATVVALYTVLRHHRAAVGAAAAAGCVAVLHFVRPGLPAPSLIDVVPNAASALLVAAAAAAVGRWQRNAQAQRRMLAERAVSDERRRIARELHDIVAHHLTTMQLLAGGARANLDRSPETAREALVTLEGSGRTALREMRHLLDVLRAGDEDDENETTAPQPGIGDLDRIVADSRRAGLPTTLTTDGDPRSLPPGVSLAVFRIVQEALTNARKHAGDGAHVDVRLAFAAHEVRVTVTDDGPRPGRPAARGSGYGLMGMRERVALHGGTLRAGPEAGGFAVRARLPLPADRQEAYA